MSDFLYQSVAFYDFGNLTSVAVGPATLTDFDNDDTFQNGDVSGLGSSYIGFVQVSGFNMPVFDDGTTISVYNSSGGLVTFPSTLPSINVGDFGFCFAHGTQIATPDGQTEVQDLKSGDLIITAEGGATPVLWVARQTIGKWTHGPKIQPVRIRAGALGGGLPQTDLTVTADHGMVIDGFVINASALVNGDTIDFVPLAELEDSFTVYHIETEAHDVILANGAASETFIDVAGRAAFDNYQEYLDLYGTERIIPEMRTYRITTQRLLPEAIKTRLGISAKLMDLDQILTA